MKNYLEYYYKELKCLYGQYLSFQIKIDLGNFWYVQKFSKGKHIVILSFWKHKM